MLMKKQKSITKRWKNNRSSLNQVKEAEVEELEEEVLEEEEVKNNLMIEVEEKIHLRNQNQR